jgi:hypothetical protein
LKYRSKISVHGLSRKFKDLYLLNLCGRSHSLYRQRISSYSTTTIQDTVRSFKDRRSNESHESWQSGDLGQLF